MLILSSLTFVHALLTLALPTQQSKQEPIRIEVEAVNVLVSVTDSRGRFITDLARERFLVFEDGKQQTITNFTHETELPLQIGLLIDTSASVRPKLEFEKTAATNFVRSVLRPQDQVLLVEFDSGVSLISDFTNRPSVITQQLRRLRAGGGTALLDAVYAVSRDKMTAPGVRKALVILSDGADLNSTRSLKESIEMAQTSGVTLYGIGTSRLGASVDHKGEQMLTDLAEGTGGQAFFPYGEASLTASFQQIDQELRSRYSLAYIPVNKARDGKFRKIRVKIEKGKKYSLRYRPGYYAQSR